MICPAAWENSADRESSVFSTEKRGGRLALVFLVRRPVSPIPSGRARCPADKDSCPAARGATSYLLHTTLSAPPRRKPHPDGIERGGSGRAARSLGARVFSVKYSELLGLRNRARALHEVTSCEGCFSKSRAFPRVHALLPRRPLTKHPPGPRPSLRHPLTNRS